MAPGQSGLGWTLSFSMPCLTASSQQCPAYGRDWVQILALPATRRPVRPSDGMVWKTKPLSSEEQRLGAKAEMSPGL